MAAFRLCAIVFVFFNSILVNARTIYSIGDLHGDSERFQQILRLLGLATFEGAVPHWTGKDAILVSTGDSVDRGKHGRKIYLTFQSLAEQAPRDGGEVVNVLGNHELMNLQGDLRYVHPVEMMPEGDYGGRKQRAQDWSRLGLIGADIRKRFVAAAVREDTLFVHGGLDPTILREYIAVNGSEPLEAMNAKMKELLNVETVPFNHRLFGAKGPFWNRFFAEKPEAQVCEVVKETLEILKAKRMVVGHTPQPQGVGTRCPTPNGPLVVLGDTVISRAYEESFGFSRPSAVEYKGDEVTALYIAPHDGSLHRVRLHPAVAEL